MKVVIVGAWKRSEHDDYDLVVKLLEALQRRYSTLRIVTFGCGRGIGKIVKNYCLPDEKGQQPVIPCIEVITHVHDEEVTSAELAAIFIARNATTVEIGEEFHLFLEGKDMKKGIMGDLLTRIKKAGLPVALYSEGEKTGPKVAVPIV